MDTPIGAVGPVPRAQAEHAAGTFAGMADSMIDVP